MVLRSFILSTSSSTLRLSEMTDKKLPSGNSGTPKINLPRIVSLNMVREDSWCIYADGFKHAAELLIANVKDTYEINTVIFPILALYRQYVELTLKEIIAYGQYIDGHGVQQGGHDLKQLWGTTRAHIRNHYSNYEKDQLDRIEQLICELHNLDPSSEATRYPFIKSKATPGGRAKSFSYDTDPINLDVLAGKIRELGDKLHNVTNYLSACQDLEAEFRADYYG